MTLSTITLKMSPYISQEKRLIEMSTTATASSTLTAKSLIVESVTGYAELHNMKIKVNELIKAHNLLVRTLFPNENKRLVGNELEGMSPAALEMLKGVPLPMQARLEKNPNRITDLELINLTMLIKQWGWVCKCVTPIANRKGFVVLCSSCNKPIEEVEHDRYR